MGYNSAPPCTSCDLHKTCKNVLLLGRGSRPKRTKYMVIQDASTKTDDKMGTVLGGDASPKFAYFLDRAGIDKSQVFFTSAIKCKPRELSDIKNRHIEACRDHLFYEILEHKPEVIITMGRYAYEALTSKKAVREFRGHFDQFDLDYEVEVNGKELERSISIKVMPTFGLNASLAKWEYNGDIIRDFKKAKKYLETGVIDVTPPCAVNTILSKRGLKDFVEKYREVEKATTDYETTGFDFWKHSIINAGYYSGDGIADIIYLTPYKKIHSDKWDKENIQRAKQINSFLKGNRPKCVKALKTVNSFKQLKLILHNGKFDAKFAAANDMPYRNFWFDTLIADSLVDENMGHSLNIAMERRGINFGAYDTLLWPYTNKAEKTKKSYQFVPPFLLEKYLGIDVYGDWLLYEEQEIELKREKQRKYFFKQKMPALRKMVEIEYVGVRADKKLLSKISKIISRKQLIIQDKLVKITGKEDFNSNSPDQINNYMVEANYPLAKLGIKETKKGYSTKASELEKFMKFKKYKEFPKQLLNMKKLTKIKGTYVDGKDGDGGMVQYLDTKNRVHAGFNLWSPRTGRYSCSRPSLQVWPRPIKGLPNTRQAIIPTNKDWGLFEADYSQLEQCVVAALSKDKILTKKIQDGTDLHCFNAVELGHKLQTVPDWVTYEHMIVANGKQFDVGLDEYIVKKCLEEINKRNIVFDWKESRSQSKNIGFGLNYGKGALTFAKEFGIPEDEAEDMVAAYFELYHGMKSWRDAIVNEALTKGFISLLTGRRRRFHAAVDWINSDFAEKSWSAKRMREEISRQAMNYPVQGGAHDVFEPACTRLINRFRKEGMRARLLLSIHDGIVGEAPKEELKYMSAILKKEMAHSFNKGTKLEINLNLDVDFYGREWYGEKIKI